MRIVCKFAVLLAIWGFGCIAIAQTLQPTISIDARNMTVASGEPILLHIVLKNTTNREFSVFRSVGGSRGEYFYTIILTAPDGHAAAFTEYGAAAQKQELIIISRIMKTVAPGETVDESVSINRLFDMSKTGTYIVQVTRASPLDPATILKSNALKITVEIR